MRLDYLGKLEFGDESFIYGGRSYNYSDISSIEFQAVETGADVDFIRAGTSDSACLRVHLSDGRTVNIAQERSFWRGERRRLRTEALWQATEILSERSFTNRLEPFEKSLAGSGFFPFGDYRFHRNGDVFRHGELLFNLEDKTISARLAPFHLHFVREKRGLENATGAAFDLDHAIDLSRDRDCLLYMLHHVYGLTWRGEALRAKRPNPRDLFLTAIVKLGAQLAKADGTVLPGEISMLKRHFRIDRDSFPEAEAIFSEALSGIETSESIARQIIEATQNNREFRQYIVIGLVMIAASDGAYHPAEHRVIARVAGVLGFAADDLDHIIAMCDVRREERHDERRTGGTDAAAVARHLRVLGLSAHATANQIKAAYRALARQHHPDHLAGKGVPIDRIKAAENILKTINASYAWLMANSAAVGSSQH